MARVFLPSGLTRNATPHYDTSEAPAGATSVECCNDDDGVFSVGWHDPSCCGCGGGGSSVTVYIWCSFCCV